MFHQQLKKNLAVFAAIGSGVLVGLPALAQNTTIMNAPASVRDRMMNESSQIDQRNSGDSMTPSESDSNTINQPMNRDSSTPMNNEMNNDRMSPANRRQSFNQTNRVSPLNPCPSIFYDTAYSRMNLIPEGCPAVRPTQDQSQNINPGNLPNENRDR